MTYILLAFIAVSLTCTMFITRQSMLGFACVLFWSIFGGYAYTQSTIPWGDWQFYTAFGSLLGMNVLCGFGAFGLREKRDSIADKEMEQGDGTFIDEKKNGDKSKEDDVFNTETGEKPSRRSVALRKRAENRRTANW